LAVSVAGALDYAHRHQIVHRDIKPENILLEEGQAVVADFGIARALQAAEAGNLTETGVTLGTATYMSPEQATGDQLDGRSDIYSLGCVLYEMLAGEPPYTGPTAPAIIAKRFSEPIPHVRTLRETVPEPPPQAFRVAGPDSGVWREGLVDLLSINLDGAPGVRVIAPRTVLSRWNANVGRRAEVADQDAALGVARAVGARFALTGSLVGGNRSVRLSAGIRDTRRGTDLGIEQVEGSPDSVPAPV